MSAFPHDLLIKTPTIGFRAPPENQDGLISKPSTNCICKDPISLSVVTATDSKDFYVRFGGDTTQPTAGENKGRTFKK